MSGIDQNNRIVGLGYAPDIQDITQPFLVNPANGKLKLEIIPKALNAFVVNKKNIPIDENNRNIGAGLTDDISKTLTPLSVDLIQGTPCLRIKT